MTENKRIRPKYLNWKCIDNFDKVSDDKIFYDCKEMKLTNMQRHIARREFAKLNVKWSKIIGDWIKEINGQTKTHLTMAGGNYTFFFVLPQVIEWVSKKYPFLGVEIQLFERGGSARLEDQNADIVLTSSLRGEITHRYEGYDKQRKYAKDMQFFATSAQSLQQFKTQQNVLIYQDVLFSRIYATQASPIEIKRLYAAIPHGREVSPRVIVDQYFLECKMLANSVGLGYLYSSMKLDHNIVQLNEQPMEQIERFVIVKKNLNKKYRKVARQCIDILKYKGSKL